MLDLYKDIMVAYQSHIDQKSGNKMKVKQVTSYNYRTVAYQSHITSPPTSNEYPGDNTYVS